MINKAARGGREMSSFFRLVGVGVLLSVALNSCDDGPKSDAATFDVRAATAAAAALAETVDAFATQLGSQLPPEADTAAALEFAREVASEPGEEARMRRAADLYVALAKKTKQALDDGREAAYQVFEAIVIVSPALAVKRDGSGGEKVFREVLPGMMEKLTNQFDSHKLENKAEFVRLLLHELPRVASVGLYMQTETDGRHAARERMERLPGVNGPPRDLVDDVGDLQLPIPLDERTRDRLAEWLNPIPGENWLFEVADGWVTTEGALYDLIVDRVTPVLFEK